MPVKHLLAFIMMPAILLLGAGCQGIKKEPPPENLLDEPLYLGMLIELQHIRTYVRAQPDSVNADSLNQLVFKKFGVEKDDFLASHRYYQSDIEGHIQRIERAIQHLEEEEETIQSYIDSVKAAQRNQQDSLMVADSLKEQGAPGQP